jgi:hypothetical protein
MNTTYLRHTYWVVQPLALQMELYSVNWLVFITETECLLRGTSWIFNTVAAPVSHPEFNIGGAPQMSVLLWSHVHRPALSFRDTVVWER